ncbi:tRNA wybutosine-synthesizing protein 3 homolog [Rhipicephalus sanguineus]|uniref:tRNA wybutosine-synthesizing protein 3 homolog n=1 Tax=Rhipicephalus sanguineus TaxID=34632 RepID=UPI0018946B66|nr:tRNA wybutosine-synthesizing protein 3 homolog [Rhipicephalus sanguineus]
MDSFAKEKRERLGGADVSRKGTIDSRIIDVTDRLNSFPQYCTTSSCSGRIIFFSGAESDVGKPAAKKGCQWHLVTHDLLTQDELDKTLATVNKSATLKFEPFILHVWCHTLDAAQKLLAVSIGAGCRNSGIMLSKSGKVHVAVRTTLSLEVPLSDNENILVTPMYLNFLRKQANEKMTENWKRLQRFSDALSKLHCENEGKSATRQLPRDSLVARTKTKKTSVAFDYDESVSGLFDFSS